MDDCAAGHLLALLVEWMVDKSVALMVQLMDEELVEWLGATEIVFMLEAMD